MVSSLRREGVGEILVEGIRVNEADGLEMR